MTEPEHGTLLSGCCDALPFMNLDPEWDAQLQVWIGMCGKCKEHSDFYDENKEEP